jgi:hypothetical protein
VNVSKFTTAFCDSAAALSAVTEDGLSADSRVLTASPFLQMALGPCAEFLRDRVSSDTLADILGVRLELQTRALRVVRAVPAIQDYGEVAALRLLTSLDLIVLASCLTQADCDEPRLIIRTITGDARADRGCNGPWPALLANNGQAFVRDVRVTIETLNAAPRSASPGLYDRLRVAGWQRAAFRAICALGALWPNHAGREALILSENELLHETAFALALRGWSLRKIHLNGKPAPLGGAETSALAAACRDVLKPYCERWVIEPIRAPLIALITERVLSAARDQKTAAAEFERVLATRPASQSRVMLSNFPASPSIVGPWHVARRHGIPLFGFQHGVSSEMCEMQDATIATKEVMCSDRSYTFNERASAVANAIADRQGVSIPVGMPGDMRRMKFAPGKRLATIAFVSTAVYSGYWDRLAYGTRNDAGMLAFELQMIHGALAGLQHDVLYKRYPSIRLLDPDPAAAAAEAIPNIRVYSDHVDMRYLMGACDVLVAARATSTLSWCLMSDKPVVYVDIADDMRLRGDARPAFEKGLFLFSTAQPDWIAKLRAFLDQPVVDIQRAWQEKAVDRRELVQRFFDMGGPAGTRAAKDIAAYVGRMKAGDLAVAAAS